MGGVSAGRSVIRGDRAATIHTEPIILNPVDQKERVAQWPIEATPRGGMTSGGRQVVCRR